MLQSIKEYYRILQNITEYFWRIYLDQFLGLFLDERQTPPKCLKCRASKIYTQVASSYFSYLPYLCMYVNWTKSTTKEISQNIWEAQSRVITEIRIGCKASNLSLSKSIVENCKLYRNSLFRIQSWPDTYYIPNYATKFSTWCNILAVTISFDSQSIGFMVEV